MSALRLPAPLAGAVLGVGAVIAGAAGAAAYTLSAYLVSPWILPVAALAGAYVIVTLARPAWGVAGALLLIPLEVLNLSFAGGALSPSEAAFVLVAGAWAARALLWPETVARPALRDAPVIVLLGVVAAGTLVADRPAAVLRVFILWTLFYCVYLQAQTFTLAEIRGVLLAFAVGAGVLGALGAVGYLGSGATGVLAGGSVTRARAVGTFADANYYASMLVLAGIPAIALLMASPRRNAWLLPCIAGVVAGLLFSLSRGGIAAFAAALLLLLAWRRARWIAVGIVTLFVALTALDANPVMKSDRFAAVEERLTTLGGHSSVQSRRPQIWRTAVEIATDHPLIGVGVNQFKQEAARRQLFERGGALENAHSVPLSLAAETGFLGLAAGMAFGLQLVTRGLRAVRFSERLPYALGLGLAGALLAFAIQGLTVVQIRTPVVTAAAFAFAGMLTALADRAGQRERGGDPAIPPDGSPRQAAGTPRPSSPPPRAAPAGA